MLIYIAFCDKAATYIRMALLFASASLLPKNMLVMRYDMPNIAAPFISIFS